MASITDYVRMCKVHGGRCSTCPLNDLKDEYIRNCVGVLSIRTNKASAIIDKWCAEHPQKTYWQDFKEKFPNAEHYIVCRAAIYEGSEACTNREKSCCACWNEVMPEEGDEHGA